jgi:hypothetical protein
MQLKNFANNVNFKLNHKIMLQRISICLKLKRILFDVDFINF